MCVCATYTYYVIVSGFKFTGKRKNGNILGWSKTEESTNWKTPQFMNGDRRPTITRNKNRFYMLYIRSSVKKMSFINLIRNKYTHWEVYISAIIHYASNKWPKNQKHEYDDSLIRFKCNRFQYEFYRIFYSYVYLAHVRHV